MNPELRTHPEMTFEIIVQEAKTKITNSPKFHESRWILSPEKDPLSEIANLQTSAIEYTNERNLPPNLAAVCSLTYDLVANHYNSRNPRKFELVYKATLHKVLRQIITADPRTIYMKEWMDTHLSNIKKSYALSETHDIYLPEEEHEYIEFVPIVNPHLISKNTSSIQRVHDVKDIHITFDEENTLVSGVLCSPLIVTESGKAPERKQIPYAIFIDKRVFSEKNERDKILLLDRNHQLNLQDVPAKKDARRKNIISLKRRSSHLPVCTQEEVMIGAVFEDKMETYNDQNVIEVSDYYAYERILKFLRSLPLDLRRPLQIMYGLPDEEVGSFEAQNVLHHTLRVQTFYQLDSRKITLVSQLAQETMVFLHDVAKGVAIEYKKHKDQHQYIIPVMKKIIEHFVNAGVFETYEQESMLSLVDQNIIGDYMFVKPVKSIPENSTVLQEQSIAVEKNLATAEEHFKQIITKLRLSKEEASEYWQWMQKFYFADAGSYQNKACVVANYKATNKKPGKMLIPGALSLDDMFIINDQGEIQFSQNASSVMKAQFEPDYSYKKHFQKLDTRIQQYIAQMTAQS